MSAMDVPEIYRRASAQFGERVGAIGEHQWDAPTPLPGWDVRDLVHHLVHEERWTPPLFAGSTMAEVGDRFDGDLLGSDPVATQADAAAAALAAVCADGAMDRTVHLSFGDHPGREYAMQLAADHLVHAWDLACGIGADETLDPETVAAIDAWFPQVQQTYLELGVIGPPVEVAPDAGQQARLLAAFGRRAGR